MKKAWKSAFSLFLTLCMVVTMVPAVALANETGCTHEHDESCGYVAAVAEQPCTYKGEEPHEHGADCGYMAAVEGAACTHVCSVECGGVAETPAEKPVETPTETPADPAAVPAETPAETPTEKPAETPAEKPAETPADPAAVPAAQAEDEDVVPQTNEVAEIVNGGKYATLQAAINAAEDGQTIKLLTNLENIGDISINKNLTIDGCNMIISGDSAFWAGASNNITIKNTQFKDIHNAVNKKSAVYGSKLSEKLTITNCTFSNCDWDAIQITPVAGAQIIITDNTFTNEGNPSTNARRFVHIESGTNTDFYATVTDNKMYVNDPLLETALEVYYFTDKEKVELSGNYINYPASCILMNRGTNVSGMIFPLRSHADVNIDDYTEALAEVRDTYNWYFFDSFNAAADAAMEKIRSVYLNGNVTLSKDITANVIIPAGKTVTIDLNGHTLTNRSNTNTIENNGTLILDDSVGTGKVINNITGSSVLRNKATATVKGGELVKSHPEATSYTIYNTGSVNIEDGKVSASANAPACVYNYTNGNVTMSGGTISGGKIAVKGVENGSTIAIEGGTVNGSVVTWGRRSNSSQEFVPNPTTISGNVVINGDIVVVNGGVIGEKLPSVEITGGFVSGNIYKASANQNKDPYTRDDSANANISISGGHFTSDPSAYKANGLYVVESKEPGYFFTLTNDPPRNVPVIVTETVETDVNIPGASDGVIQKIEDVIDNAEATGISTALKSEAKEEILKEAGVTIPENASRVEVEVGVQVKATKANLDENGYSLNYQLEPVATVKVDGEERGTTPTVPNEYLNGKLITVKLPVAGDIPLNKIVEVKHTCKDGTVEYFYKETGDKRFTLDEANRMVIIQINKFSDILLSATVTAAAKADGVGYPTLQEAVDAVQDGGTVEVLANGNGQSASVRGRKTFRVEMADDVEGTFTLTAGGGYKLYDDGNGNFTVKKKSSSSDSSSYEPTYSVSKVDEIKNGKVTADLSKAAKGDKVTITVTPDKGYVIDKVIVKDADGDKLELKDKGNGEYTFTMPDSKVEIKATFVKESEKVEETVKPEEVPAAEKIVLTMNQRVANVFGEPVVNDVAPIIRNDRTMLPIRFVAQAMGATVAWDGTLQKVTITKGEDVIDIYINSAVAFVNGNPVDLDSPAFIENSRTYLPLRFVAENLGADVYWNAEAQEVTVVPKK